MRNLVVALSSSQATEFCTGLWFELTLVGRAIWSDSNLDLAAQLNALKWLNEMQHAWGGFTSRKTNAMASLLDQLLLHAEQAPSLQPHLRIALDRALQAVARRHGSGPSAGGPN